MTGTGHVPGWTHGPYSPTEYHARQGRLTSARQSEGCQIRVLIQLGQRVIGVGYGAFADYTVMPVAALAPVPAGWRDEQALGLVLNWATALAALKPLGRLAAGETVLIALRRSSPR
jgi:threonine dehydrogenase-like Zn-dependent dehydrogenase